MISERRTDAMSDDAWSGNIDNQSGYRLPLPGRDALDARGRAVMDRQLDPERDSLVGLRGPVGIRLHSPAIAEHGQALIDFFRNPSQLTPRVQEVAILVTARAHDSEFEWAAHEPAARRAGVPGETISAIRDQSCLTDIADDDALIIAFGRELFAQRRVSDELFAKAHARHGSKGLVELVSLMATYAGTAHLLAAFDMQLPDGKSGAFS
jgi:4-carboxymuconolactone decarboxylase